MHANHPHPTVLSTLATRAAAVVMLIAMAVMPVRGREYTKEAPLVYEDAWDLWPYVFLDDQGQPAGYNVDLVKMIMKELDIPYVIRLKPTQQALEDLRNGESDLMFGMVASFHDGFAQYGRVNVQLFTHSVAYARNTGQRIYSIEDIERQKVIVHEGSFSHHIIEERGWGDNAIASNDMAKAIQEVSADGNGQVLWNTQSLRWLIYRYHTDNLVLSPVEMPSGDYRFMSLDRDLLSLMDDTFSRLKANGKLADTERQWFQPEAAANDKYIPRWLWILAAVIGAIVLTLIVANIIYHVRARYVTREGRRRNNRLALILQTCQMRMWSYDIYRHIFTWYGNAPGELRNMSEQDFSQLFRPADFKELMDAIERASSGEGSEQRVGPIVFSGKMDEDTATDEGEAAAAEERLYDVRISVLRRRHGEVSKLMGTMSDVTEDQRQQQETAELASRYKAVFTTAMTDMVAYDGDGRITNMNQRAQRTFAMPLNEVLQSGVKLRDILSETDFSVSDFCTTDHFNATLFIDYDKEKPMHWRHRGGSMVYELQLVAVRDTLQRLIAIYGTGRDVSEVADGYRRARQGIESLSQVQRRANEYVSNINYALQVGGVRLITYSPDSHLLTINHRMHEAQYVLTQQRCLALCDSQSQRQAMRLLRTMDRRVPTAIDADIGTSLRLPGGKRLWLQMSLFPTIDPQGNITMYSGICRDISEERHTEQRLQQETAKAQEVEQVKSQFLHNMCHEIKVPLDKVVSLAALVGQGQEAGEEQRCIDEIKEHSAYLLRLINDILFLSRLDAHMVEMNAVECDFAQTFEGQCTMVLSSKRREGVSYIIDNAYEQLMATVDVNNIGRVIEQLMDNAISHTTKGYVRARYEYIGEKLILVIEDTGEGISPEQLKHVFERFGQNSHNAINAERGTGLGLPICREIVTQLGGTIDISSEVGKGTQVWVTLPCHATLVKHKPADSKQDGDKE